MMIEHRLMSWWRAGLVLVALSSACTKPNPKSCQDGTCTDPAFPFCDVDGALTGEAETCIAIACTANEFVACRGDRAITCNTTGTDYELELCSGGCNEAARGCRRCEPNETVCENGQVQTCDADGAVVASEVCPLGCFEDQPRCRQVDPSNNLGMYLDMVTNAPDLDLSAATFVVDTGVVSAGGIMLTVPNFLHPSAGNGASIRVFVVNSLRLNSATFYVTGDPRATVSSAVAIVSKGEIRVEGELILGPRIGGAVQGCLAGHSTSIDISGNTLRGGGGGGGNATAGAKGGNAGLNAFGGTMDGVSGAATLVPLRGGCRGAFSTNPGDYHNGGGALQLSAGTRIDVDATIDVRGSVGEVELPGTTGDAGATGGGGAGGSILLEAPDVILKANVRLLASGGAGGEFCQHVSFPCGLGGAGATSTSLATPGGDATPSSSPAIGGGGGGGLGRVRINSRDSTYTKSSSVLEDASVTAGTIRTR